MQKQKKNLKASHMQLHCQMNQMRYINNPPFVPVAVLSFNLEGKLVARPIITPCLHSKLHKLFSGRPVIKKLPWCVSLVPLWQEEVLRDVSSLGKMTTGYMSINGTAIVKSISHTQTHQLLFMWQGNHATISQKRCFGLCNRSCAIFCLT